MYKILRAEQSRAEQSRAEQSRARLSWLDVLKGIGIILVVVGHVYSNQIVFNWIYSFHMPLFFFAAGWVYKEKPVWTDIRRRVQTIVIPYFSFGFLILIYWQLLERRFRESDMGFVESLFGLFSGAYDNLDFNVHLWFLPCFFLTVVLFNILVHVGKRISAVRGKRTNLNGKKMVYAVSALMSVLYVIVPLLHIEVPGLLWGFDRVFQYIGFYAIGNILAEKKIDLMIMSGWTQKPVRKIIAAVILLTVNYTLAWFQLDTGVMWFVSAMVGISGIVVISLLICNNRVLEYLGRISLVVLCVHGPVYRIVVKVMSFLLHMSTDAVREKFILALLVVGVTLAACSMVYEIVLSIVPWMVGKKTGKKP